MIPAEDPEAAARSRFQALILVRMAGIGFLVAGFLLWKTPLLGVQLERTGMLTVGVGAVLSLVVPRVLLRLWRTR